MNKLISLVKSPYSYLYLLVIIFVLFRIPLLGFDIVNSDAPRWVTRIYAFSSAFFSGDYAETAVKYHPGVTLLWIGTFSLKIYNFISETFYGYVDTASPIGFMWLLFTHKLFLVTFLALTLGISLYLLDKIFGKSFVIIFFTLFTFEPVVIGYTRVLHTDALVAFTSFTSILAFYYAFTYKSIEKINLPLVKIQINKQFIWYGISALYTGLAILTKSNALFLFAFTGLHLLVLSLYKYKANLINIGNLLQVAKLYFGWMLGVIFIFVGLWPAMWVRPLETLDYFIYGIVDIGIEGGHSQQWFGLETLDPGFWYYPLTLFISYSPWFIFIVLIGIGLYTHGLLKNYDKKSFLLISALFVLTYFVFISIPSKKIDRYILPTIPFLSIFGALFINGFIENARKLMSPKLLLGMLILIICSLSIISTYKIFPNYLAFRSPLVGGFNNSELIVNHKWPLAQRELYLYLNNLDNAEEIEVFVDDPTVYSPLLISKVHSFGDLFISKPGDLVIIRSFNDWDDIQVNRTFHHVITIRMGHIDYYMIYQVQ